MKLDEEDLKDLKKIEVLIEDIKTYACDLSETDYNTKLMIRPVCLMAKSASEKLERIVLKINS